MVGDKMKWVCTFALMAFVAWWGHYTVSVTYQALAEPQAINVLEVAGASGLLGSLVTLLTLTIQYCFGKPSHNSAGNPLKPLRKPPRALRCPF